MLSQQDIPAREQFLDIQADAAQYYRSGVFDCKSAQFTLILPIGNIRTNSQQMSLTPEQLGKIIRQTRKQLGVTQADLALTSGTGLRFIGDLENGKPTCQIGKALRVMQTLGIGLEAIPPHSLGSS